jgi:D-aminopeptidase
MSAMNSALQTRVDALFADLSGRAVPGYAVGLLRDGEVLLSRGYGLSCLAQQTPICGETVFRIASVSKQFTVAAALLLEQRGLLNRQDDVRLHLPELAELPITVTLGHLMRNTSGLPDMLELLRLGGVNLDLRVDRATLLRTMARNRHLNFEPGSRFLYSNSGFALLGLVIERLSRRSLGDLLQAEFFGPLGMSATRMLVESDVPLPGLASPCLSDGHGGWRRAQHGFEHGGEGGLVSTTQDLLLWAAHLLQPTPGVPDLSAALCNRVPLAAGCDSPYAYGLEYGQLDGLTTLGHGGLWPGYRSEFLLLPEARLAVVVLSNDGGNNPYKVARELARLVLGKAAASLARSDAAAALVGTWLNAEHGQLFDLSMQGGRLMAQQWGVSFELQQQADGRWLPLRGAYEFQLQGKADGELALDIGAGRIVGCRRVAERSALPPGLAGSYGCEDLQAHWRIEADDSGGLQLWAEGPLLKTQQAWTLHGLDGDLIELRAAGYWMLSSQLLRLRRDAAGTVCGFEVDSSRIKGLRFQRQSIL